MGRATALGAALIALALAAQAQAATPAHTVPWTAEAGMQAQAGAPDSDPVGSNDFSFEPDRRRPHPVVLAHGLAANKTVNWSTISPFLANRGFWRPWQWGGGFGAILRGRCRRRTSRSASR